MTQRYESLPSLFADLYIWPDNSFIVSLQQRKKEGGMKAYAPEVNKRTLIDVLKDVLCTWDVFAVKSH